MQFFPLEKVTIVPDIPFANESPPTDESLRSILRLVRKLAGKRMDMLSLDLTELHVRFIQYHIS